jgi:hypothetical protein
MLKQLVGIGQFYISTMSIVISNLSKFIEGMKETVNVYECATNESLIIQMLTMIGTKC